MRREGSLLRGTWTIMAKETADHLTSTRLWILEGLILLVAGGAVYSAIHQVRATVSQDPFVFLSLFTAATPPLPSFMVFLGFLVPVVSIALGFDAINTEYSRRTLSRLLSQPIYRDALLIGKFLAGLTTLAVVFLTLWLLVMGLGLLTIGVPPSGQEILRSIVFLAVTVAYGGVWLALAMMFSVVCRQQATAALSALAVWLLLAVFWSMLAPLAAQALSPDGVTTAAQLQHAEIQLAISRLSPNVLYGEATLAMLHPATRAFGPVLYSQLQGALLGAPLPFGQSLLLIWPEITGLVAAMIVIFTVTYTLFQRQEIRA